MRTPCSSWPEFLLAGKSHLLNSCTRAVGGYTSGLKRVAVGPAQARSAFVRFTLLALCNFAVCHKRFQLLAVALFWLPRCLSPQGWYLAGPGQLLRPVPLASSTSKDQRSRWQRPREFLLTVHSLPNRLGAVIKRLLWSQLSRWRLVGCEVVWVGWSFFDLFC